MVTGLAIWRLYREWLLLEAELAPRTVVAYHWIWFDWLGFLAPLAWHEAGPAELRGYLNRPARTGRARGQPLSANSRLHYAATIVGPYRWAHTHGHLPVDPLATVTLPRGGDPVPRSFTLAQLATILADAQADQRTAMLVGLAYYGGLRCAEIAALQVQDVHLERRPGWLLVHGKGRKDRRVPLHPQLRATITGHLAAAGHPRTGPLVTNKRHPTEPMNPGSVSRALSDHIRRCGLQGSGHGLRHSFAEELLAVAGERRLVTISRLLGHASTDVTEKVYLLGYQGAPDRVVAMLPNPLRRRAEGVRRGRR